MILKTKRKKMSTAVNENCLRQILTKLIFARLQGFLWRGSKSGQIKGLDVTFQMHSIAKIFDIVKYLKNQKDPKRQKGPNFFSGASSSKQNEKNEHC